MITDVKIGQINGNTGTLLAVYYLAGFLMFLKRSLLTLQNNEIMILKPKA